jgi:D-mannonate dehydratase
VTAPIPNSVETYIDNGYTDMWKPMKTLVDVDFRGNLIADHGPQWRVGDLSRRKAYTAVTFGRDGK